MEALQSRPQHRPVDLTQQPIGDVHDAAGVDAQEVAIEREMVDRAEVQSVDDGGDSCRLDVGNDVGGLNEGALAQRADRAATAISAHDVELEALLVQPVARFDGRVRADVRTRDEADRLHVLDGQAGFQHDHPRTRVVRRDEHRRDHEVLTRRQRPEVDDRRLQCEGSAQCAVVRLVDRSVPVGVAETRARVVEGVGVGVLE